MYVQSFSYLAGLEVTEKFVNTTVPGGWLGGRVGGEQLEKKANLSQLELTIG